MALTYNDNAITEKRINTAIKSLHPKSSAICFLFIVHILSPVIELWPPKAPLLSFM
jgi:hypothetical protein